MHDYKVRTFVDEQLPVHPDYWCTKHTVNSPEEDNWIHYLSHELVGLTRDEIEREYGHDPEIVSIITEISGL